MTECDAMRLTLQEKLYRIHIYQDDLLEIERQPVTIPQNAGFDLTHVLGVDPADEAQHRARVIVGRLDFQHAERGDSKSQTRAKWFAGSAFARPRYDEISEMTSVRQCGRNRFLSICSARI